MQRGGSSLSSHTRNNTKQNKTKRGERTQNESEKTKAEQGGGRATRKLKVACHWTMNWSPAPSFTHSSPSHSLFPVTHSPQSLTTIHSGGIESRSKRGAAGEKQASRVCELRVFAYAKGQTRPEERTEEGQSEGPRETVWFRHSEKVLVYPPWQIWTNQHKWERNTTSHVLKNKIL